MQKFNKENLKKLTIFSNTKHFSSKSKRYPGNLLESLQGDMELYGEKIAKDFQEVIDHFEQGDDKIASEKLDSIYNAVAFRPFQKARYATTNTGLSLHSTVMLKLYRAKELLEINLENQPVSHKQ